MPSRKFFKKAHNFLTLSFPLYVMALPAIVCYNNTIYYSIGEEYSAV